MGKKEGKHSNSRDASLFRDAVGDANPIDSRERHPLGSGSKNRRPQKVSDPRPPPPVDDDVEFGEELSFDRGGTSRRLMRDLRRGNLPIGDVLDLHGLTAAEAPTIIDDFISDSLRRNYRCIRIVHGKGLRSGSRGPVLKGIVSGCLRARPEVLAFRSAQPSQGGTGAVLVLLKNR